jgi:hypothetical protein
MPSNLDSAQAISDQSVRSLAASLPGMRSLILESCEITDDTLKLLAEQCGELRELHLVNTLITDEGLRLVAQLTSLDWIYIDNARISDKGIAHLKKLPCLKGLHLIGTDVTDDGLAMLPEIAGLVYLENVTQKEIGQKGYGALTSISGLEYLRLSAVKTEEQQFLGLKLVNSLLSFTFEMPGVSDHAVEYLQKRFPDCFMNRYRFCRYEDQAVFVASTKIEVFRTRLLSSTKRIIPEPQQPRLWGQTNEPAHGAWRQDGCSENVSGTLSRDEIAFLLERGLLEPSFLRLESLNCGFRSAPAKVITPSSPQILGPRSTPENKLRELIEISKITDEERQKRPWTW